MNARTTGITVAALLTCTSAVAGGGDGWVRVGPGRLAPLYAPSPEEKVVDLPAFELRRTPVTNADFLGFLRKNPQWRRDQIKRVFADEGYLTHWSGPASLGPEAHAKAPVVRVSWFAARAYCASLGGRLPREYEWELAAQASETEADATADAAFSERILGWYAQKTPKVLPPVGRGKPNFHGVEDLHGLVWEWVLDFGNTLISGDSRESQDPDRMKFCGAGAANASQKADYASFMRFAFRSSLEARYSIANLGFRCARDVKGSTP